MPGEIAPGQMDARAAIFVTKIPLLALRFLQTINFVHEALALPETIVMVRFAEQNSALERLVRQTFNVVGAFTALAQ